MGSGSSRNWEEAGAFVVSLDLKRSWFRYHRLFADLLRVELQRSSALIVAELAGADLRVEQLIHAASVAVTAVA